MTMKDALRLAERVLRLNRKMSPAPWTEDDGNVFSRPLSDQRHAAIMRRMSGSNEPHPDDVNDDHGGKPLGWICSTQQAQPNFDIDARGLAEMRNAAPMLAAALRESLKPGGRK